MKAVTRKKYGGIEVLRIIDIPKPETKENEVLVKVYCTTVNRTDCGILTGKPFLIRFFTGLFKPSSLVSGTDFAGEVVGIGNKVSSFKIGDRVWGLNDEGLASQAEFMVIKEKKAIVLIPNNIPYNEAVACAEGAHYAFNFINKVKLKKEHKILINGATGAIGSAALQLIKSQGIKVTAVGNTKNIELIKSLGADKIYNYEKEDFTEIDDEKYDFILDAVGKSSFGACKKLLAPKGIYISSELGPGAENLYLPLITKLKGGKRVIFPIPSNCTRTLNSMNALLEQNKFKSVIDKEYDMKDIAKAYEYVMTGEKTGNVVINFKI